MDLTSPSKATPPENFQDRSTPKARRANLLAWLWQFLGITLIVVGVLGAITVFASHGSLKQELGELLDGPFASAVAAGLSGLVSAAGVACFNYGKKLKAVSARALVSEDSRPPVLYLRSFKDDATAATINPTGIFGAQFNVETEEEQLAKVMNEIGPFVAIGKPGEKLPELGAVRKYVSADEWQDTITNLMLQARLVVLRVGETDGFWWEVERAVEKLSPEKLLFLLPYDKADYELFRMMARKHLPCELPAYEQASFLRNSSIKGYIYFEPGWVPHFVKLTAPFTRAIGFGSEFERKLRSSLRPAYEQLNIPWHPPRFRWAYNSLFVGGLLTGIIVISFLALSIRGPSSVSTEKSFRRRSPELERALEGLSPAEANSRLEKLISNGLGRVDSSILLQRASVLKKMLTVSDLATCDSLARGNISNPQVEEILKKLDPADVQAFLDVLEQSALAELRGYIQPEITDGAISDSLKVFLEGMPAKESERVRTFVSGNYSRFIGFEACHAARHLYEKLTTLEEPHRTTLLRALVQK